MTSRPVEMPALYRARPHMTDPSRTMAAWFTNPPGLVVQFTRQAPCTVPLAQWLAGPVSDGVRKKFPGDGPLVFVLDLTHMNGRDPSARPLIVDAARAFVSRAKRAVIVPPQGANRVYLASVSAAASLARVFGLVVSVEPLHEAVRSLSAAAHDG